MAMGDFSGAVADLERVVSQDPEYDFHRAIGLLPHAHARGGEAERVRRALFRHVR